MKSEPGDDDRAPEQPRLLRRSIALLVEENVMPLEAIPRHFGMSERDLEMLAGLPEGYFSTPAKVIELARVRMDRPSSAALSASDGKVLAFSGRKI